MAIENTVSLAIFDPRSSIVKSVVYCSLSGVMSTITQSPVTGLSGILRSARNPSFLNLRTNMNTYQQERISDTGILGTIAN